MSTKKSKTATKPKKSIVRKIADFVTGKKAASSRAKKYKDRSEQEDSPAHNYEHKKMNLKKNYKTHSSHKVVQQDRDVANNVSRSDQIQKHESQQRRIISGASINKKGRLF